MNFYNEHDPAAAAWIRSLIAAGLIPPGDVDERSITEIKPHELSRYTQCHFFAGIAGWSYALQLAAWPATRPVWTGSCPCQPFSVAGKGKAQADERHLWPAFFRLIRECRPDVVFGEQVASAIGHGWLDGIRADLESADYACGAAVLGAHSVGAPHRRQRLYWVADSEHPERRPKHFAGENGCDRADGGRQETHGEFGTRGEVRAGRLVHTNGAGRQPGGQATEAAGHGSAAESAGAGACGLGDAHREGCERQPLGLLGSSHQGDWGDFSIVTCLDGKARRVGTGVQPLAHGVPGRVAQLRGLGNAIVPQVAAEFVRALEEVRGLL